jgi:hypothetical protein
MLRRFLESVRDQAGPDECELVVVGDTHQGTYRTPLEAVRLLCTEFQAVYHEYDGGRHCVGHPQRQYGATVARGKWLLWSQDDNVLRPGAWRTIRTALAMGPKQPHLFKVVARGNFVVWHTQGDLSIGAIDADCIAVPNDPARLGTWALEYCGDQQFIVETVQRHKGKAVWVDAIIIDSRPGGVL